MPTEKHNFIVAAIARKMRQYGFNIAYLEGKYTEVNNAKYEIPPKIVNHRPDLIGIKGQAVCIGEAKTESDIVSSRTQTQMKDFKSVVELYQDNRLIFGIPMISKQSFLNQLEKNGIKCGKQIEVIYIPEELFPNEENI